MQGCRLHHRLCLSRSLRQQAKVRSLLPHQTNPYLTRLQRTRPRRTRPRRPLHRWSGLGGTLHHRAGPYSMPRCQAKLYAVLRSQARLHPLLHLAGLHNLLCRWANLCRSMLGRTGFHRPLHLGPRLLGMLPLRRLLRARALLR